MHDRRALPRAPLIASIWLRTRAGVDETRESRDISEGGLRLERVAAPLDALVWLMLTLPRASGRPQGHFVAGRVVWKRLNATGIQFIDPPPATVRGIRDYVESGQA